MRKGEYVYLLFAKSRQNNFRLGSVGNIYKLMPNPLAVGFSKINLLKEINIAMLGGKARRTGVSVNSSYLRRNSKRFFILYNFSLESR